MDAGLAPASFGLVLLDSQWRVLSANAEIVAAFTPREMADPDTGDALQEFGAEVARRMGTAPPPKTFSYSGFTCTVLQFSCAYGGTGQPVNAVLIQRPSESPEFVAVLSRKYQLTPRETQALASCLKGHEVKQIANQMGIGVSTAKSHLRLIGIKMGVSSRAEILSKVLDSMCEASLTCPFRPRRP